MILIQPVLISMTPKYDGSYYRTTSRITVKYSMHNDRPNASISRFRNIYRSFCCSKFNILYITKNDGLLYL